MPDQKRTSEGLRRGRVSGTLAEVGLGKHLGATTDPGDDKHQTALGGVSKVGAVGAARQDLAVVSRQGGLVEHLVGEAAREDEPLLHLPLRLCEVVVLESCVPTVQPSVQLEAAMLCRAIAVGGAWIQAQRGNGIRGDQANISMAADL